MKSMMILSLALVTLAAGCRGEEAEGGEAAPTAPAEVDRSLPGDPEAGAAVYARVCVACHAADGRGNGGLTGADFIGDTSRLAKSNEDLIRSITHGVLDKSPPMPAQGQVLSEQEIKDVLSYIRREFGGAR